MQSFLLNFNSTQTITIENYSKISLFLLQQREEKEPISQKKYGEKCVFKKNLNFYTVF
jgi:hypothetical protein